MQIAQESAQVNVMVAVTATAEIHATVIVLIYVVVVVGQPAEEIVALIVHTHALEHV